jgi:hypothetical protein
MKLLAALLIAIGFGVLLFSFERPAGCGLLRLVGWLCYGLGVAVLKCIDRLLTRRI